MDHIKLDCQLNGTKVCCLKDQVVSDCYNECSANTCANLKNPPRICTLKCATDVCVCKKGLYLNECNECVSADQCYTDCKKPEAIKCKGPFESLYGCFNSNEAKVCPDISYSRPRDAFLQFSLISKQKNLCALNICDCSNGFLRNKCGECVQPGDCGKSCHRIACEEPNAEVRKVLTYQNCEININECENETCTEKCADEQCREKCKTNNIKCKKCRIIRHICVCKAGYARNKCGMCVLANKAMDDVPCLCTNPCSDPNQEWQCYNECNRPTCQNYYDLPTKLCSKSCSYDCYCSQNKGLWFNGTACVPSIMCPIPYDLQTSVV